MDSKGGDVSVLLHTRSVTTEMAFGFVKEKHFVEPNENIGLILHLLFSYFPPLLTFPVTVADWKPMSQMSSSQSAPLPNCVLEIIDDPL